MKAVTKAEKSFQESHEKKLTEQLEKLRKEISQENSLNKKLEIQNEVSGSS